MQSISVAEAAEMLLARVATNVSEGRSTMLELLARELAQHVRIYGLDSRAQRYREITKEDLSGSLFDAGATVLHAADGTVFTQMTVQPEDWEAYLARLKELDVGDWNAGRADAA